ncbi:amino acid adenylation domain-containing protein [Kribbella sp. NPDC056861]|uniref:amino acid adenylation domain-containing protein n=1 Tax=Kribbella sp. NPDC056861 TaxID=3154857 RepID=UPI00343C2FD2
MSPVVDIYPLAPLQQGLLFHAQLEPDSGAYLQQVTLSLHGNVAKDRLRTAWSAVVDRHPALRTGFVAANLDDPVQVVAAPPSVPEWAEVDWRGLDSATALQEFLADDRRRPFSLTDPPLMRLTLAQVGDAEHLLVWTVHHLVLDGWSLPLVLADLAAYYRGTDPGPAPRPFRDFVGWQREVDLTAAKDFWRTELAGFDTPTPLPIGTPEGASFAEVTVSRPVEALQAMARREHLTLNTVIQGCWAILLGIHGRTDDVVYGAAVAGRPAELPGSERMVGMFINTLPVRARLDGSQPVGDWLRAFQDRQSEARQFDSTPLTQIQATSAVPGGTSLFETLIGVENYPLGTTDFGPHLSVRLLGGQFFTHYPLTLLFVPSEGELGIQALYDQHRYQAADVRALLDQLTVLLDQVTAGPETELRHLKLVTELPTATAVVAVVKESLIDRWDQVVAEYGDATALVDGATRSTYRELDRRAQQVAERLSHEGRGRGDVVGICAPRSVEQVAAVLGVLKCGAGYLPLDPDNPPDRLAFQIADAGVADVLLDPSLAERFPELATTALPIDGAGPAAPVRDRPEPDDLAYLIYTSGSTGRPKGVEVPHGNVISLLDATKDLYGFGTTDTWTLFHSFAFDFSVWELWGALGHGGRLVIVDFETSRDPERFAGLLADQGVTVLNQTPAAFRGLADSLRSVGRLRLVVFGGEPLDPAGLTGWFDRFGAEQPMLVNMYGITEATVHVTHHRVRPAEPASIGRPLPGVGVEVLDAHGNQLPAGVVGELVVSGTGIARGYRNRPELTAERFPEGRYRSGDLGRYLPDGTLEFHGRIDDQVQVRGFRVELGEIESVLSRHPGVDDVVVRAAEDGRLSAYLVPARDSAGPVRRLLALRSEPGLDLADLPTGVTVLSANASETDFMGREIFADRTYLQAGITLPDGACVFDVGANIGLFAVFVATVCRDPRVFTFEPLPPLQRLLRRNLDLHGITGELLPCGAGRETTSADFSYYPYATVLSGRYADLGDESAMVKAFLTSQLEAQGVELDDEVIDELLIERLRTETYTCSIRPISEVIAEYGVDHIDLLKIDVEKSELDVLAGITAEDFARIDQVVVEVHDSAGRLDQVIGLLRSHGFETTTLRDAQLTETSLYNVYASRLAPRPQPSAPAIWRGANAMLADVRAAAARDLPYYMLPESWTLLPALPLTSNGKRDLAALPAPGQNGTEAGFVPVSTATEQAIAAIWSELLDRPEIGAADNFFAIGGHSLIAARVISRIADSLGVRLPLATVFSRTTVAELAAAVDEAG